MCELEFEEYLEDAFDRGAVVVDVGVGDVHGCAFVDELVSRISLAWDSNFAQGGSRV